jgi:hypothetical protein
MIPAREGNLIWIDEGFGPDAAPRHPGQQTVGMVGLLVRRAIAAATRGASRLALDSPQRILRGPGVRHGRVVLAGVRTMWEARAVITRTGHRATELWWRGAPVVYELDERAEVRVEFGNGLVLMAVARPERGALRLTPLRRELAPLELVLVPVRRR